MLEGQGGHLAVRYQGEIIPSQAAPPRPGLLRSFNGSSSHGPSAHGGLNGWGRRWAAALAALDAEVDAGEDGIGLSFPSAQKIPFDTFNKLFQLGYSEPS